MANEIQVRTQLTVRKGKVDYQSRPGTFQASLLGDGKGPTPGAITVSTDGTDVDLSQLVSPGMCWIYNQDAANYVTLGVWDTLAATFYPLGEVGPGEGYLLKLFRNLGSDFAGTGTAPAGLTRLRLKADSAPCNVLVEAFER